MRDVAKQKTFPVYPNREPAVLKAATPGHKEMRQGIMRATNPQVPVTGE